MSLFVDSRVGSKDLLRPLLKLGLDAQLTHLDFADVAFEGKGDSNGPIDIGVELKCLPDLVSSLRSGRLVGHQLPGLRASYAYSFLIVEGRWSQNDAGLVCQKRGRRWWPLHGRMTANELEKTLLTLQLLGGLHVRFTNGRRDTLRAISVLYRWFADSPLDGHSSHLAVHVPQSLRPISAFRRAVCQWPLIGLKTSLAVETAFQGSIRKAANATVEQWAAIDIGGKRLGEKTAAHIHSFCGGL